MVILLALASGRRCSEMHVLSCRHLDSLIQEFLCSFAQTNVAKNESSSFRHSSLYLPKVGIHSSVPEVRVWCPVCTFRNYLRKIASVRGKHDRIFLSFCRASLSSSLAKWLVSELVDSGAVDEGSSPWIHSTGTIGSSWTSHKGLSVATICDFVCWKSSLTFFRVLLQR